MANPVVLVLNGPNLNLLGTREPQIYGRETLSDIENRLTGHANNRGFSIDFRQTNAEAELVDWVQASGGSAAGLIVNAGAYTHTSIALLDALRTVEKPIIEVHLSNIFRREEFRRQSYVSQAAHGVISGFGAESYILALDALASLLDALAPAAAGSTQ
jgi:3-dehydroquinate dehydratase-2